MTARMGFNPLPWYLTAEGFDPRRAPPLQEILQAIKATGYDGVHAEVPAGFTARRYKGLLEGHGLSPAPGYFQASFGDLATIATTVDKAKAVAAEHADLGLDRIFIAEQFGGAPNRIQRPAQGVDGDPQRLSKIAEGLSKVASAMAGEGVIPCLHPHVATWIETGAEAKAVLDAVSPDVLKFGPDTGHLAWAGSEPADFISTHAHRVGAVHIKDMRQSVADALRREGGSYRDAGARHIWTEPGRGDLDLGAVLAALAGFEGWYIIEVDIADQPTVEQSAKVAADWLRPRLEVRAR